MADKISASVQAAAGNVEQHIGAGTGNHSMEARGAKHRGKNDLKGRFKAFTNWLSGGGTRAKGHAKASGGALTGNNSAEGKGHLDKLKGDLKQTVNH